MSHHTRIPSLDSDQEGTFEWKGRSYPVVVLDLPCVTESYKTYDDINLVKTTDIGQVLVVGASKEQRERLAGQGRFVNESLDGVGPPMRDARARLFRDDPEVDAETVAKVEFDLLTILAGGAPAGMQFVDYEEVWKVDPETGKGEWVPAS